MQPGRATKAFRKYLRLLRGEDHLRRGAQAVAGDDSRQLHGEIHAITVVRDLLRGRADDIKGKLGEAGYSIETVRRGEQIQVELIRRSDGKMIDAARLRGDT
jgi:hypothetical protein